MSDTVNVLGRRLGYFRLPLRTVETPSDWSLHLPLFAKVVVLQAEPLPGDDVIRYLALSPLFDAVEPNQPIPSYAFVSNLTPDGVAVRAERLP